MSAANRPDASLASKALFAAGVGAVAVGNLVTRINRDDTNELPATDD